MENKITIAKRTAFKRGTHFCKSQMVEGMVRGEAGDIGDFADARFWVLGDTGLWEEWKKWWKRIIRVWKVEGFLQVGLLVVTSKHWSKHNEIRSALLEAKIKDEAESGVRKGWLSGQPMISVDEGEEVHGSGILSKNIYLTWSLMMGEVIHKSIQQWDIIYI